MLKVQLVWPASPAPPHLEIEGNIVDVLSMPYYRSPPLAVLVVDLLCGVQTFMANLLRGVRG